MTTIRKQVVEILRAADRPMTCRELLNEIAKTRDIKRQTLSAQIIDAVEAGEIVRFDGVPQQFSLPVPFGTSPRISLFDRCIRQVSHQ